jgi:hypothetical protein
LTVLSPGGWRSAESGGERRTARAELEHFRDRLVVDGLVTLQEGGISAATRRRLQRGLDLEIARLTEGQQ